MSQKDRTLGKRTYQIAAVAGWAAAGAAGCLLMSLARSRPMAALGRGQYGAADPRGWRQAPRM